MIVNRYFFLAFFLTLKTCCVLGSSSAFSSEGISCIKILPFVTLDETEIDQTSQPTTGGLEYKDKFGENKLFQNVPFNSAPGIKEQNIAMMKALIEYTAEHFGKDGTGNPVKNTCMVGITVNLEDGTFAEYCCGLYVSGFDNYEKGTVEDFLIPEEAKLHHREIRELRCRAELQTLAKVDDRLSTIAKFSGVKVHSVDSPVDVFMGHLHRPMYLYPPFGIINEMPFFPSSWFFQAKNERRETPDRAKDLKWLEEKIKERLFFTRKAVDYKKRIKDAKTPAAHMKAIEEKAEDELSKDKTCLALFDRTGLGDATSAHSCFRTEKIKDAESGGMPYYFNDSEQVFLSFLQLAGMVKGDYTPTIILVNESDSCGKATNVSLKFYSFFDMCRFCRGTLSQVLSNGFLHTHLESLLKKERIDMDENTIIEIHAFGYDRDVNKGEKK